MLIPLGILAASGGVAGDYELIESVILGTDTSSITFSSLATYASTYKHLQLRAVSRDTRSGSVGGVGIRLNGDTGSNYTGHFLFADGSSVSSGSDGTSQTITFAYYNPSGLIAANIFGAGVVDILDTYSTTKNKTFRGLTGFATNAVALKSGLRMSTESTTSLTVLPSGGNFLAGSRFSLYGIR
jgi:hypothetical protein